MAQLAYYGGAQSSTTPPIIQTPVQVPTLGNQPLANPINGFRRLAAYGLAYVILLGIGATSLWMLAPAIEGVAILGLLLSPNGTEAFTALSAFLKGVLG